jgi:hypothetical protein
VSAQLALSPPFPLPGAASPLADVATPQCRVVLLSHGDTSSLPPPNLSTMLPLVASPIKLKLKHWICNTVTGHPPRIARLPPSTGINGHLNHGHPPQHSTASPFYLLPSQSTTPSKLHRLSSFRSLIVPPHNDTHKNELADPLSLPEQLINMWIHVNIWYFEIL